MSPKGIPVPRLAEMLARVTDPPVTEAMIASDVAAGAPANPDGTVNLVLYAAWLLRQNLDGS